MKPTKSEIRGTWMLAAVCALLLSIAVMWSRRGHAESAQEAIQLPEEVVGMTEIVDTTITQTRATKNSRKRKKASKSKSTGRQQRPVNDTPSPLDRPI